MFTSSSENLRVVDCVWIWVTKKKNREYGLRLLATHLEIISDIA